MRGEPETFGRLYREALGRLPGAFEADQLFFHVTGLRRHDLPLRGEEAAPPAHAERLRALCDRRRQGEPLQYLLGEWEFYGLPFSVGPGVLIPRADTETVVDLALELAREGPCGQVLDLCSGSGCIAVALAKCLPHAAVTAVELSGDAFAYLRENIRRNGARVEAVQADVFAYVHPAPVDLLVANPPYIPRHELETLPPEVRREPAVALDGGEDGLAFYRMLASRFAPQLAPGGILCAEVGYNQSEPVQKLLRQAGFTLLSAKKDLGGVIRAVAARGPLPR